MIIDMRRRNGRDPLLILAALASLLAISTTGLAAEEPSLSGLWAFRCDGDGAAGSDLFPLAEFTAAIFQMGTAVSGPSTGDVPGAWNGMMTGRIDGGRLDLEVLLIRTPLTAARMTGAITESGDMVGTFVSSDETGSAWKGSFSATLTSPDTSLYEPASPEPLTFVPAVSGGISDFQELTMTPPVEEAPKRREVQVIGYTRDTIYSRPVM